MPYGFPASQVNAAVAAQMSAPMAVPHAIVRIGEQAIWSAQRYVDATALASTTGRLFTTALGNTGQGFAAGLSIAETNQREGGKIPAGQAFDIFAISAHLYYSAAAGQFPIVGADVRNFINNCVITWDFLQAQIEVAPGVLVGAGGGVYGDTADTGAAEGGSGGSRIALNNGNGSLWVYQTHPVILSANATFAVLLQWGVLASVVDGGSNNEAMIIRIHLLGRFKNAIAVG